MSIYYEGYRAHIRGESSNMNPHKGSDACRWSHGWNIARFDFLNDPTTTTDEFYRDPEEVGYDEFFRNKHQNYNPWVLSVVQGKDWQKGWERAKEDAHEMMVEGFHDH